MKRAMHIFYKDMTIHAGIRSLAQSHMILPVFLWSKKLNQDEVNTPSLDYRIAWAKHFNHHILPQETDFLQVTSALDIQHLCKRYNIECVTMLRHYEPREVAFQRELKEQLNKEGIKLHLLALYTMLEPEKVLKSNGDPYIKFTPYYQKWRSLIVAKSAPVVKIKWLEQPKAWAALECAYDYSHAIEEDLDKFKHFMQEGWQFYEQTRDYPALDASSHLSALLNHGVKNVHSIVGYILKQPFHDQWEAFLRQLAWRDFYIAIMHHFPKAVDENFNSHITIKWLNDKEDFLLWCNGKTGYPLVDASMRCLKHTGRLHNRLRMVTASFLTKDLLIDWKEGAHWFKRHLIDYDLASNAGGWQWSASTGVDAVPYFRVFNPITQSEKWDKEGAFILEHIKELKSTPIKYIHNPQKHGIVYIPRCIEHDFARRRLLDQFKS